MPYTSEISVTNNTPGCLVFLVDQSDSMKDLWKKGDKPKCEAVATIINRLLDTTILRCSKNEGVRDYFHIGVIGYGPGNKAKFAWSGSLAGREFVTVNELRENAQIIKVNKKIDAGDGTLIEREIEMPKWFDPVGEGSTPMAEAFHLAIEKLNGWIGSYPNSFPPIIFNITDGEPNDAKKAEQSAKSLTNMTTSDGNLLLFNIHISDKEGQEILFPVHDETLPDKKAKLLFRMSSVLPEPFINVAKEECLPANEGSRGFLFNADSVKLIEFIDIGTRTQNLR